MMRTATLLLVAAASVSGGCAALTNPVADGIPVRRLPAEVLGRPKEEMRPIPLTLLRQKEQKEYRLAPGDVLRFDARIPHRYVGGAQACLLLCVLTAPGVLPTSR